MQPRKPSMNEYLTSHLESNLVITQSKSQFYTDKKQCGSMPQLFDGQNLNHFQQAEFTSLDKLGDISSHNSEYTRSAKNEHGTEGYGGDASSHQVWGNSVFSTDHCEIISVDKEDDNEDDFDEIMKLASLNSLQ